MKAIVGGDGVNETQKQVLPQAIAIFAKEYPTSLLLESERDSETAAVSLPKWR